MILPDWKDQSAILVGGGASLKGYDFAKLTGLNVIGVNEAFRLGSHAVKVCLFGDGTWFQRVKWDLERYAEHGGKVFAIVPKPYAWKLPWLTFLHRQSSGVYQLPTCGWNYSTGAAAINLATGLGANRIFLLGYDLCAKGPRTHWHNQYARITHPSSFAGFAKGFLQIAARLPMVFPQARVFNVTDGHSKLQAFPRISFEQFDMFLNHGQIPTIPENR